MKRFSYLGTALVALWSAASFAQGYAPAPAQFQGASVGAPTSVEPMHVTGLHRYAGKVLRVFYVSARQSALSTSGDSLKIRAVMTSPVEVTISPDGEADVPATVVPHGKNFFDVFNFIVFCADEAQGALFLKNVDGSFPKDPRVADAQWSAMPAAAFQYDRMSYLSVPRFEQIKASQAGKLPVNIEFGRDTQQ
jgi:hypothetical protein